MRELERSCPSAAMRVEAAYILFKKAVEEVRSGRISRSRLVWLELTGCSGNIISLLDGARPGFGELTAELSDILFENSLMVAEGEQAMDELFGAEKGSFYPGCGGGGFHKRRRYVHRHRETEGDACDSPQRGA